MRRGSGPEPSEKAILVLVNGDPAEDEIAEAELDGLCEAAGVEPVGALRQRLEKPHNATYIGKGKAEEAAAMVRAFDAELAIVDTELSGIQNRNLSEAIGRRVIDRTQLILDIFARRARTKEGMLQVELAQLNYMMPRLMSVYTKFERQRGGIGMRGPGEMKLEADRRVVRERVLKLGQELSEVRAARRQQRSGRRKTPFPFASIIGYTSAGKSTLMNALAGTELLADAMPFATLDPTTRKVELPNGYGLFLTDTVGFIRNLPTNLVAAFRSTLEEVTFSDFLIHVVDASNPMWELQTDAVRETLRALEAADKPTVTVFNKADLVADSFARRRLEEEHPGSVAVSALTGVGMDRLLERLAAEIQGLLGSVRALVPYDESGLVQQCYEYGRVGRVEYRDAGIYVEAEVVRDLKERLQKYAVADDS